MSDVTRIINAIERGDARAVDDLVPLVYRELRRIAASLLAHERPGQTLQATALVHEAYLRLAGSEPQRWTGRGHFFGAAAEAMRRILVESARRKQCAKRGGERRRVELAEEAIEWSVATDELLAVDEALDRLAGVDPKGGELVKLRYFAGMTSAEAAAALNISPRAAKRLWAYARAWLRRAMRESGPPPHAQKSGVSGIVGPFRRVFSHEGIEGKTFALWRRAYEHPVGRSGQTHFPGSRGYQILRGAVGLSR